MGSTFLNHNHSHRHAKPKMVIDTFKKPEYKFEIGVPLDLQVKHQDLILYDTTESMFSNMSSVKKSNDQITNKNLEPREPIQYEKYNTDYGIIESESSKFGYNIDNSKQTLTTNNNHDITNISLKRVPGETQKYFAIDL